MRFDHSKTLDLRTSLPTAAEAVKRAESWLRERQASIGGEVLIITGRGRGSEGGVAVVRPAIERRLARLRREGVVAEVREHTPGSLIVTLAPLSDMLTAIRRKNDQPPPLLPMSPVLGDIEPRSRALLFSLAVRSLETLGVPRTEALVADEMERHFSRLAHALPDGPDRAQLLFDAAALELDERFGG